MCSFNVHNSCTKQVLLSPCYNEESEAEIICPRHQVATGKTDLNPRVGEAEMQIVLKVEVCTIPTPYLLKGVSRLHKWGECP